MRRLTHLVVAVPALLLVLGHPVQLQTVAAETAWSAALAGMPLPANIPALTRSNAMRMVLENFQSNTVIRAVIFLPGAADDFYLIQRDQPIDTHGRYRHLAEAIEVLIARTPVRAHFTNGLLLLHTAGDRLQLEVASDAVDGRKKSPPRAHRVLWVDAHWQNVQPMLRKMLSRPVQPESDSREAWHFERANLSGHGLHERELLQALALATGTKITASGRRFTFERLK